MFVKLITPMINQKVCSIIISKYLQKKLGAAKNIKIRVNLEPNVQPKFIKTRIVPFAMKEAVKAEVV